MGLSPLVQTVQRKLREFDVKPETVEKAGQFGIDFIHVVVFMVRASLIIAAAVLVLVVLAKILA